MLSWKHGDWDMRTQYQNKQKQYLARFNFYTTQWPTVNWKCLLRQIYIENIRGGGREKRREEKRRDGRGGEVGGSEGEGTEEQIGNLSDTHKVKTEFLDNPTFPW